MRTVFKITGLAMLFSLSQQRALGCLSEYPTHNYYMIRYSDPVGENNRHSEEIAAFWKEYSNGRFKEYPTYDISGLKRYIENNGDTEMLAYVNLLNLYLDFSAEMSDLDWLYPTKEDLAERDSLLKAMADECASYKGKRLRSQYALLYMRSNMLLKRWQEIERFWISTARHLPQNVYRAMMENIYAGALFRKGALEEATEIYSRQGDEQSIRWTLRKYRNLAGIKKIYDINPNSYSLYYLVQDFVNNVQESIDTEDEEFILAMGHLKILKEEALGFCEFADSVLSQGKVSDPCMWGTAQAMAYYLVGDERAQESVTRAMSLDGTERVKDNCRCVRLLIESSSASCDTSWLIGELKWLEAKCQNEQQGDYCFSNAYDRILVKALAPRLKAEGRREMALAVLAMYNEYMVQHSNYHHRSLSYNAELLGLSTWNNDFRSEFAQDYLFPLPAKECEEFFDFIRAPHADALERYVCQRVYKDDDFYNDLIGTKYTAEARFNDAVRFHEKVSLDYLSKLNVSYYMKNRDYNIEKWMCGQRSKDDELNEGMRNIKFSSNPKLQFCRDMLKLQNEYGHKSFKSEGPALAYKLATMYYQASYKGDCWWLTDYGNSVWAFKPSNEWENDFVKSAKVCLEAAKTSKNDELVGKSLFASAFIAIQFINEKYDDPSYEDEMLFDDGDAYSRLFNPVPMSEHYNTLNELSNYWEGHKEHIPEYMSRCDVLKKFRKLKWIMNY